MRTPPYTRVVWGHLLRAAALATSLALAPSCGVRPHENADDGGDDGGADGGTYAAALDGGEPDAGPVCVFPAAGADTVVTDYGAVRGGFIDGGLAFLGVPFAEPPVGALRFQTPEAPACWSGVRDATAFGAECVQKRYEQADTSDDAGQVFGSEDCLTLNVWTPGLAGARPVLVYLHGGGEQQGSASQLTSGARLFDGQALATRHGVVVVTLQYRLGPLGFLYAPGVSSGNLGLLDQTAALAWVQRHAARFGGDPTRVMLFGESAGAVNTCMHLVMPRSRGLFSRALMESGACVAKAPTTRLDEGAAYLRDVGCAAPDAGSQLACLAKLGPAELLAPLGRPLEGGAVQMAFGPTIDGTVIPEDPLGALAAGRHAQVPLVVGVNADEMAVSAPRVATPTMVEALYLQLPQGFRAQARQLYPPGTTNTEARASYVGMLTDAQFVCTARATARAAVSSQSAPVFRYYFSHALRGPQAYFGSFHGIELFFVFASLETSHYALSPGLSADDRAVISLLGSSWAAFAATANPSTNPAVWPMYSVATDPYLELGPSPGARAGLRTAKCDFWDAVAGR
jgi:para-nitrobenzyl esterase